MLQKVLKLNKSQLLHTIQQVPFKEALAHRVPLVSVICLLRDLERRLFYTPFQPRVYFYPVLQTILCIH